MPNDPRPPSKLPVRLELPAKVLKHPSAELSRRVEDLAKQHPFLATYVTELRAHLLTKGRNEGHEQGCIDGLTTGIEIMLDKDYEEAISILGTRKHERWDSLVAEISALRPAVELSPFAPTLDVGTQTNPITTHDVSIQTSTNPRQDSSTQTSTMEPPEPLNWATEADKIPIVCAVSIPTPLTPLPGSRLPPRDLSVLRSPSSEPFATLRRRSRRCNIQSRPSHTCNEDRPHTSPRRLRHRRHHDLPQSPPDMLGLDQALKVLRDGLESLTVFLEATRTSPYRKGPPGVGPLARLHMIT